nr:hypothetical protein [Angustibacter aerolatus]
MQRDDRAEVTVQVPRGTAVRISTVQADGLLHGLHAAASVRTVSGEPRGRRRARAGRVAHHQRADRRARSARPAARQHGQRLAHRERRRACPACR